MSNTRNHELMEKRRLKAAKLFDEGLNPTDVSRKLKVRPQSAHDWYKVWKEHGAAGLKSKGKAGVKSKLSEMDKANIVGALLEGPKAHGYLTEVWTLPRVAKLIEKLVGERYHPSHVSRILHSLRFSCQQPSRRAIERDEENIKTWKQEVWPRLKKKRAERAEP